MPFGSSQWMYSSGFYPTVIDQSLMFDGTAYLSRTPSVAGDRKTWTWSAWVKRSALGASYFMPFGADAGGGTGAAIYFYNDLLYFGQGATTYRATSSVYRDTSSWYHVLLTLDTTDATAVDRVKIYINGNQVTSFSTTNNPSVNADLAFNNNVAHAVGADIPNTGARNFFNGYLADTYLVDGTALDPTSFGEFKNGVWIPKRYTGSYGTNGFHLEYDGNPNDSSGTGNNWTATNIVAGDYMLDSPTNNYATWNPLRPNAAMTYSDGNLSATSSGGSGRSSYGTLGMSSGKWYFELTGGDNSVGVATNESDIYAIYLASGSYNINGTTISGKATYTTTDIIGIAYNADGSVIEFFKNGASQGSTSFTAGFNLPIVAQFNGTFSATRTCIANFGASGFTYTPPAGFLALSTANLPEPSISPLYGASPQDHFNTVLWSGNSSTQSITGVGFQPDLVWAKERTSTSGHTLLDTVRGVNLGLESDSTAAELNYPIDALTSFDADGFSLGSNGRINEISQTYVAWCWKASNAASVLNEAGSIDSQVSANTTAGFSIVSYTGTGVNATVGHGLNVAPDMVIVKSRGPVLRDWVVYNSSEGATKYMYLSTTAESTSSSTRWNDTEPTSDVFSLGTSGATNALSENFITYCFHSVEGYSKFGSYTGNGSADGTFVYTGFRPAYVLIKRTTTAGYNWFVLDSARNTSNAVNKYLYPDLPNSEGSAYTVCDFLSNGFKFRDLRGDWNGSGVPYIYMAFAENPFKYSVAR